MTTIAGLPAHPLLVHAAVVLVPMACLVVVAYGLLPSVRARLGAGVPVFAGLAVVAAFLAKSAGESLAHSPAAADVSRAALHSHAEAGDAVVLWSAGVFVLAALLYARQADPFAGARARVPVLAAPATAWIVTAVAIVICVVAVYVTVSAGHSGAALVWGSRP